MTARFSRLRVADAPTASPLRYRRSFRAGVVILVACLTMAGRMTRAQGPHPAVARVIVPERSATSYGSGTLIDVREQYGLVVTNWHVVRDATGPPEVVFPNGFRSTARPLKLDSNWDLAALVIWRPPIEPVAIAPLPPRPGDPLKICGYGQGEYRVAAGRCTQYYAPRVDYPHELLELDVEARQGDSGGPIFNAQGELAGVLFGAGRGTTMGSYGGRVQSFLASLAPNIGQNTQQQMAQMPPTRANVAAGSGGSGVASRSPAERIGKPASLLPPESLAEAHRPADRVVRNDYAPIWDHEDVSATGDWVSPIPAVISASSSVAAADSGRADANGRPPLASLPSTSSATEPFGRGDLAGRSWLAQFTTVLAVVGAIAVVLQLAKLASR